MSEVNFSFDKYTHSYKILSLSTISTPTPLDDLKECNEYPWVNIDLD
jgi:hypothetical protein